jgi:uncharacterized repeat protein (TIGR01451 family)
MGARNILPITAVKIIPNTAKVSFMGVQLPSNTVYTFNAIPPTINKSVDKSVAVAGDTLNYTMYLTNNAPFSMINENFIDLIESGSEYMVGTFAIDGATYPALSANDLLTAVLPDIAPNQTIKITFSTLADMLPV